eukprot:gnl/TRDRNA2_/TRDRNA2_158996_c1_seq1.p1 gnl/TRDRNA2_/TRDRNA2_158996_c1~~gnl/TRDRNA2_/TRDRNA2_158996_c1_seq1.p1  ORF type:complete len:976 (+),score=273.60 gnl/TRDRNA2_/TRDRNA2_158996_c1_seq1:43-2928(+)
MGQEHCLLRDEDKRKRAHRKSVEFDDFLKEVAQSKAGRAGRSPRRSVQACDVAFAGATPRHEKLGNDSLKRPRDSNAALATPRHKMTAVEPPLDDDTGVKRPVTVKGTVVSTATKAAAESAAAEAQALASQKAAADAQAAARKLAERLDAAKRAAEEQAAENRAFADRAASKAQAVLKLAEEQAALQSGSADKIFVLSAVARVANRRARELNAADLTNSADTQRLAEEQAAAADKAAADQAATQNVAAEAQATARRLAAEQGAVPRRRAEEAIADRAAPPVPETDALAQAAQKLVEEQAAAQKAAAEKAAAYRVFKAQATARKLAADEAAAAQRATAMEHAAAHAAAEKLAEQHAEAQRAAAEKAAADWVAKQAAARKLAEQQQQAAAVRKAAAEKAAVEQAAAQARARKLAEELAAEVEATAKKDAEASAQRFAEIQSALARRAAAEKAAAEQAAAEAAAQRLAEERAAARRAATERAAAEQAAAQATAPSLSQKLAEHRAAAAQSAAAEKAVAEQAAAQVTARKLATERAAAQSAAADKASADRDAAEQQTAGCEAADTAGTATTKVLQKSKTAPMLIDTSLRLKYFQKTEDMSAEEFKLHRDARVVAALRNTYEEWAGATADELEFIECYEGHQCCAMQVVNKARPDARPAAFHFISAELRPSKETVFYRRMEAAAKAIAAAGLAPTWITQDPHGAWYLESWEGDILGRGNYLQENSLSQVEELGRLLARIHAVNPAWYKSHREQLQKKYPGLRDAPDGCHIWWYTARPMPRMANIKEISAKLLRTWIEAGPLPRTVPGKRLVTAHCDFHPANIVRTPAGLKVIDFEFSCATCAVQDLSLAFTLWLKTSTMKEAFVKSYLKEAKLPATPKDVFDFRLDIELCTLTYGCPRNPDSLANAIRYLDEHKKFTPRYLESKAFADRAFADVEIAKAIVQSGFSKAMQYRTPGQLQSQDDCSVQ